jgi:hypothetical protein
MKRPMRRDIPLDDTCPVMQEVIVLVSKHLISNTSYVMRIGQHMG